MGSQKYVSILDRRGLCPWKAQRINIYMIFKILKKFSCIILNFLNIKIVLKIDWFPCFNYKVDFKRTKKNKIFKLARK